MGCGTMDLTDFVDASQRDTGNYHKVLGTCTAIFLLYQLGFWKVGSQSFTNIHEFRQFFKHYSLPKERKSPFLDMLGKKLGSCHLDRL